MVILCRPEDTIVLQVTLGLELVSRLRLAFRPAGVMLSAHASSPAESAKYIALNPSYPILPVDQTPRIYRSLTEMFVVFRNSNSEDYHIVPSREKIPGLIKKPDSAQRLVAEMQHPRSIPTIALKQWLHPQPGSGAWPKPPLR